MLKFLKKPEKDQGRTVVEDIGNLIGLTILTENIRLLLTTEAL